MKDQSFTIKQRQIAIKMFHVKHFKLSKRLTYNLLYTTLKLSQTYLLLYLIS